MTQARTTARRRCLAVVVITLAGLLPVAGAVAGAVPQPSARGAPSRAPTCAGGVRVSFGATGLGAGHVDAYVVFTNATARTCTMDGYPRERYVTRSGATIGEPAAPVPQPHGPVTLAPGAAAVALLRTSVPGVSAPDACRQAPAWGLVVRSPGAAPVHRLHFPESVCAGRKDRASTTTPVDPGRGPVPSGCPGAQLVATLGRAQSAAGTTYVPLVLTNPVLYTCVASGYPRVTSVSGDARHEVGPPARDVPGPALAVWVQPFGGTASAALGIVDTSSFPSGACRPRSATGFEVLAPRATVATYLAYRHDVCTHLASTNVSALVAGRRG